MWILELLFVGPPSFWIAWGACQQAAALHGLFIVWTSGGGGILDGFSTLLPGERHLGS